jgi:RecA-family ATPase
LVEDLLPRKGATLVYGLQKSGKSIFAVQSAIAVATGVALFQNYQILKPGGVLLLEQDDPDGAASIKEILEVARVPLSAPIHFVPKQDCFYIGSEMLNWLDRLIRELGLVLIVLNSYTALRAPHPPGVDIVKHENQEMTMLDELGKNTSCLIQLIHHDSKGAAGLDWSSKAGGTYAMTMATESQIYISRYSELAIDARERHLRLQGRHLASRELALRFDKDIMSYELMLEGAGASLYPLILQLKSEFGTQAFNAKLLVETTGASRATAFRQIAALFRGGVLTRTGNGDYQLAPPEGRKG